MSAVLAGFAALAMPLAACSSVPDGESAAEMGNATPLPSSGAAAGEPAGQVVPLDFKVTGAARVADRILLRAGDKVLSGTAEHPAMNVNEVDEACGDLAASDNIAVLPCPDGIHVLAANGSGTAVIGRGTAYSAALGLSDGRVVGHRADSDTVDVFGADGEHSDNFRVTRHGSQLVPISSQRDGTVLLEFNRPETSVREIMLDASRTGEGLRAGIGVGPAAAAPDGSFVAAADTKGGQLLIYTADDIIRLNQASPVPEGPWAVTVDSRRDLVWVASTVDSVLTAWDISGGTSVKAAEIPLVADAQALVSTAGGGLVAYSASGAGAQILDAAALDAALDEYRDEFEAESRLFEPREPVDRIPSGAGGDSERDSGGNSDEDSGANSGAGDGRN